MNAPPIHQQSLCPVGLPEGGLAHRAVAAYLVSEVLGWDVVPLTWLRDGPSSEGTA